jgi:uncharacterized membrane protein YqjE
MAISTEEMRARQQAAQGDEVKIAQAIQEVTDRAQLLIREEIELAKVEVEEKAMSIARGAVVGAVAGFFVFMAMIFLLIGAALGLDDLLGNAYLWAGFLIVAGALLLLAGLGAFIAVRALKRGTPPTPDRAIEEARLIRETVKHPEVLAPSETREQEIQATGTGRG